MTIYRPIVAAAFGVASCFLLTLSSSAQQRRQGRAAGQRSGPRGQAHSPANHPPSMPAYQGQVMQVPHYPHYRPARPVPAAPGFTPQRPVPVAPGPGPQRRAPAPPGFAPQRPAPAEPKASPARPPVNVPPRHPARHAEFKWVEPAKHIEPTKHVEPAKHVEPERTRPERPAPPAGKAGQAKPRFPFHPPERDDRGHKLDARPIRNVTKNATIVHETLMAPDVTRLVSKLASSNSDKDGLDHWYGQGGGRFDHRYDAKHDRHWFGFYRDGRSLWTVYHRDHYWWREEHSGRWLSFWRDHWWWHSPAGPYYVYIGTQFYQWNPTETGVVLVQTPAAPAPAAETEPEAAPPGELPGAPPSASAPPAFTSASETLVVSPQPVFHYSADGTRLVQVEGGELSAYLYDNTKQSAEGDHKLIRFLGDGVTDVRFSGTSKGDPLRITIDIQSGAGGLRRLTLDGDGNPVSGDGKEQAPSSVSKEIAPPEAPTAGAGELPPSEPPMPDGEF